MNVLQRFSRLTLWNKIGVIGSVASIIGLAAFILSYSNSSTMETRITQHGGNNGTQIIHQGTGNVISNPSSESFQQYIAEGSTGVVHTGTGDFHIGITLEQYEQGLKRRETEVTEKLVLGKVKKQYRRLLESQLNDIQQRLEDSEQSYQKHINDLRKRIIQLESIRGQVPDYLLDQAQAGLTLGDAKQADELFELIEDKAQSAFTPFADVVHSADSAIMNESILEDTDDKNIQTDVVTSEEAETYINLMLTAAVQSPLELADERVDKVQGEVVSLRIWSAPDHVRLVFEADSVVDHQLFTLDKPHRLVLDLKNTRLTKHLPDAGKKNKFIKKLHSAKRNKKDVRVVLDLSRAVKPKTFSLKPNRQYGHRLVIDIYDKHMPTNGRSTKSFKAIETSGQRDVIIAIDPGHGGEDPGAQGRKGTYEKDVVLAISRHLVRMINQKKGMKGVLIRDGDYYLGLRKRMAKAREHRADLFVSIHADAFRDPRASGSSVYTLSRSGASNEAARWLAESENSADLVGGVSLEDKDETLASVLLDLYQIGTLQASTEAAERVLKRLKKLGKTYKRKVQQAGFMVLKSPDIPSMLVETAFISNPEEERRLKSPSHQKKVAKALLDGISNYFEYQPPPGTWLATKRLKEAP